MSHPRRALVARPGARRARVLAAAVALFVAHAALVVWGIQRTYVTFDEPGYLQSGLSHWQTGTFGMYRVNPPLPRMVATLPVLAAEPRTDWSTLEHWRARPAARPEFRMADAFIRNNGMRLFELVKIARYPNLLWSVLGAAVVFSWARRRSGDGAALLALGCWCFEPNILAHAAVCTPDLPATAMAVTALFALDGYLRAPAWRSALLFGALLGVALLTKLTLLVLLPIGAVLAWRASRRGARVRLFVPLMAALALSLVVVHGGYGFRGVLPRLGDIPFVSSTFSGIDVGERAEDGGLSANRFAGTALAGVRLPLPEEMMRGIDVQRRDFQVGLRSYLRGEWRNEGWWYYYLYGLALKVPLGLWGLVALAGVVALRRPVAGELGVLLPPAVILAFVSSQTGFSHHLRYVLPVFPFLFIHVARLVPWARRQGRARTALVGALALSAAASSLAVVPHSLGYFNALAGGTRGGPRHLLDSNIDWGQDLLELRDWMARHPDPRPLHLAYFGQVNPSVEGIVYEPVPAQPSFSSEQMSLWSEGFGPKPGLHAISVGYVFGATFPVGDGHWGRRKVQPDDYAYFRELEPVAVLGGSIWVYDIGEDDANRLRAELGMPPVGAGTARTASAY